MKSNNIKTLINSPAFKEMLNITESLGPFHTNPKIDELYRTLRILGFSEEQTKKFINSKINTRNKKDQ